MPATAPPSRENKHDMKRHTTLRSAALVLAILLLFCGCASSKKEKTVVASIDEYEVSYELMRYFVRNLMRDEAGGNEDYWTEERAAERAAVNAAAAGGGRQRSAVRRQ